MSQTADEQHNRNLTLPRHSFRCVIIYTESDETSRDREIKHYVTPWGWYGIVYVKWYTLFLLRNLNFGERVINGFVEQKLIEIILKKSTNAVSCLQKKKTKIKARKLI